jgi:hypothetical protein
MHTHCRYPDTENEDDDDDDGDDCFRVCFGGGQSTENVTSLAGELESVASKNDNAENDTTTEMSLYFRYTTTATLPKRPELCRRCALKSISLRIHSVYLYHQGLLLPPRRMRFAVAYTMIYACCRGAALQRPPPVRIVDWSDRRWGNALVNARRIVANQVIFTELSSTSVSTLLSIL